MTFSQFYHFLVVKLFDRVQELSREQCSGCKVKHRFDILHPCITTPLHKRIERFFPFAKAEALDNMDKLLKMYKEAFVLFCDPIQYLEAGDNFVTSFPVSNLIDRRYINEDTDSVFAFDSSWTVKEEPPAQEPKITIKKRQANPPIKSQPQKVDIEAIADKPKRQRTTKKTSA